jgi:hypothetical protein
VPGAKPPIPAVFATIDCSKTKVLADIASDRILRDRLLRQLAASSAWHVGQERGLIVATRIDAQEGETAETDSNFGIQMRLFLGGYRLAGDIEQVGLGKAGVTEVKLPIFPDKYLAGSDSRLEVVAGEGEAFVGIEIFELSKDEQRKLTREALSRVVGELETFKQKSAEVEENGFIQALTPVGSVVNMEGPGSLKVEDGMQKGIYEVSGYLNPGEPGYITIEVIYNKTGIPIAHEIMAIRTMQYVGWSKDPRQKFAFKTEVTLNEMVPETEGKDLDVTFRVVFHPLQTRVLLEKQQRASTWER